MSSQEPDDWYNRTALTFTFLFHSLLLQPPHPMPGAYNLMLQSQENAMSEFIYLLASGCLGSTVLSPKRSTLEKIPLDSGSSA